MSTILRGKTLITNRTRHWRTELIQENDEMERSCLFTNFLLSDQGRSRKLVCSMNAGHPDYEEYAELFAAAPETKKELIEKRKEVIDLTAELDRAKRRINALEKERDEAGKTVVDLTFKLANIQLEHQAEKNALIKTNNYLIQEQSEYEDKVFVANEAWQEKVDSLEEQLSVKQINERYLKPVFLFAAGFATAAVSILFMMRWYFKP